MRVRYSFSSRRTGTIEGHNRHRTAFPKIVNDVVNASDIVLEILDARFLDKTRGIELEEYIKEKNKILIYVLNKADTVDIDVVQKTGKLGRLRPYVFFSSKSHIGTKNLRTRIKIEVKRLKLDREVNVGVVGYPNTGKSTLINILIGRRSARVSAESGFTKGMQKFRLFKGVMIIDTPGVIPEGENSAINIGDLKKHAEISVRTYDKVKYPDLIVASLMKENPGVFEKFYGIDAGGDSEILVEEVGMRKKLMKKGGKADLDRAARVVLKDWQMGNIRA